jgi:hypothetical protein
MGRSLEIEADGRNIHLRIREFEGIGRAEYDSLERCTIVRAKGLIEDLTKAVKEAEAAESTWIDEQIETLTKTKSGIESQLTSLLKQREKRLIVEPTNARAESN